MIHKRTNHECYLFEGETGREIWTHELTSKRIEELMNYSA